MKFVKRRFFLTEYKYDRLKIDANQMNIFYFISQWFKVRCNAKIKCVCVCVCVVCVCVVKD